MKVVLSSVVDCLPSNDMRQTNVAVKGPATRTFCWLRTRTKVFNKGPALAQSSLRTGKNGWWEKKPNYQAWLLEACKRNPSRMQLAFHAQISMSQNAVGFPPSDQHVPKRSCWRQPVLTSSSQMIACTWQCYLATLFLTGVGLAACKPITVIWYHCQEHNSPKHCLGMKWSTARKTVSSTH